MGGPKQEIRHRLRQRRGQLAPATVIAAGTSVGRLLRNCPAFEAARGVIGYIAADNEVPTVDLLLSAAEAGKELYLPKCKEGSPRLVRWSPGEPLVAGLGQVLEPLSPQPAEILTPAVALVPLVAWDERGNRLGRGAGVYDRLLAVLGCAPTIVKIGLAYEFQRVPALPQDPWDVPLDYIITEERVVDVAATSSVTLQEGGSLT